MIMPIISYGSKILKQKSKDISIDYPNLKDLIREIETVYYTHFGSASVLSNFKLKYYEL